MYVEASVSNRPPTDIGTTAEGRAFLDEDLKREGTQILPCGLQYRVLRSGERFAASPKLTSACACHYRSMLLDGT